MKRALLVPLAALVLPFATVQAQDTTAAGVDVWSDTWAYRWEIQPPSEASTGFPFLVSRSVELSGRLSLAVEEGTWTGQMDNDRGGRSRLWHLSSIVVEGNRLLFTATLVRGSLPRRVTINWGITMRHITVDVILDGDRFLGEWRGYGSLSGRFSGTRR